jgi:hypothetical protein
MLVFPFTSLSVVAAIAVALLVLEASVSGTEEGSGAGVESMEGMRWTRDRASLTWWSENSSKGSRLERMVPEKRTGSWGMMARRVRRSWSFNFEMSTPSMWMLPRRASRKRKSARERVDLPAREVSTITRRNAGLLTCSCSSYDTDALIHVCFESETFEN